MAAMTYAKNPRNVSFAPVSNMVPVPVEFREFLYQTYGIERNAMAYFNRQEPNRIYVISHGKLNYIDISTVNPKSSRMFEKRERVVSGGIKTGLYSNRYTWQVLTDVEREELKKDNNNVPVVALNGHHVNIVAIRLQKRRRKSTYKTSLCRRFRKTGDCHHGETCIFAHGEGELRPPPPAHPKYKTQLCNNFLRWNCCPYGGRCQFVHERLNKSVGFTNLKKIVDSAAVENNSHMQNFNVGQLNIRKPLPLAKQNNFCYPVANPVFKEARNVGHSTETIENRNIEDTVHRDQLIGDVDPVKGNNIMDRNSNSVHNDSVLKWINERLNNMKMVD